MHSPPPHPGLRNLFTALILGLIAGCSGPSAPGIHGLPGSPPATDIEINSQTFIGTWSLTDSQNQLFNVIVEKGGKARSNWSGDTVFGEFGQWEEYEGRWGRGIEITYRDGWRDVILVGSRGYEKVSFKPRSSTEGWPESFGIAVRLRGVRVPLSGIFSMNDSENKDVIVINLKSNGLAESSLRPNNPGVWTPRKQDAWIYWADDWREHLIYDKSSDTYTLRSWQPSSDGHGVPTSTRPASRLESPLPTP